MITIGEEQAAVLDRAWRTDFHRRLEALYRQELTELTNSLDEPALLARVAEADTRAMSHGVRTERGISQFVGLSLVLGADFDQHPRVREYLVQDGRNQDHKMDLLVDCLAEIERQDRGDRSE